MNNEPVAWLIQTKTAHQFTFKEPTIIPLDAGVIPLYTHPVKEQELLSEIAHLKAELDTANKAYMWMDETYKGVLAELELLKSHPVKELTDEEIMELSYMTSDNEPIAFVRAILRKAQEK